MKKSLSILLAILLSLSNAGFMHATHYCFGRKVKSGFTQDKNAMNCLMAVHKSSSKACNKKDSLQNKSCCDNTLISIATDSEFNGTKLVLDFQTFTFLSLFLQDTFLQLLYSTKEMLRLRILM